jgi:outer membrane protein OmpA-like peptidoglycan-associated protein
MTKTITAAAVGLTIATVLGVWLLVSAFRELEHEVLAEKQRSTTLSAELEDRSQALSRSRLEAELAREEAARAAREAERAMDDAEQHSAAAVAAYDEMRAAEQGRSRAEQSAAEALERENRARRELAELHQRREVELDRMHQALSKIAPTRRTVSGMVIELAHDSFYFDFDKAALRPENREILSRVAGVLLASQGYRLFVDGHTDDTGSAEYNQDLSFRRASSVADYLRQAGVPDEVIQVQGFGKSNPRTENDSRAARQQNRRVEIGIVDSVIRYAEVVPKA